MHNSNPAFADRTVSDYRHLCGNYIRSLVPQDYIIVERSRMWPSLLPLLQPLYDPESDVDADLKKYTVQWIASELPQHFHGAVKAVWKTDGGILDRDTTYWQYQERRTLEKLSVKYAGWEGIVKVVRGDESVYYCD